MCRTKPAESQVQWTKNPSSGWKVYYTTTCCTIKRRCRIGWDELCLTPGNKPAEPSFFFFLQSLSLSQMYTHAFKHTYTHLLLCTDKAKVVFPYSPSPSPAFPLSSLTLTIFQPALQYGIHKKKKKKSMLGHTQLLQQRKCTVQAHCWAFQWVRHESAKNH